MQYYPELIIKDLEKYKTEQFSEIDLIESLESITNLITERDLNDLRSQLISTIGEFETIRWMEEKQKQRNLFLKLISELENYLKNLKIN